MPSIMIIDDEETERIAGVAMTHPSRRLYPGNTLTKRDLAEYYLAVAGRMLPHVRNRLLSLVRCPDGQSGECFFQKHPGSGVPDAIKIVTIKEADGKQADYLYVTDRSGLVALVQIRALEIHIWGSTLNDIERPSRLVFDLDPDEGLPFGAVRRAARGLRDRLDALGLKTFPLVTGGKGVHVVAPLDRRRSWPEVKAFARAFASLCAEDEPGRFVALASKQRRGGKVFIDYLRNERGSTAIAPYSTRARPGVPVATPVTWKELDELAAPNRFKPRDIVVRIKKRADPWPDYLKLRQSITARAMRAVGAED